jgi:hypothetical protein
MHGVSREIPDRDSPQSPPGVVSPATTGHEDRQSREERPGLMDPVGR